MSEQLLTLDQAAAKLGWEGKWRRLRLKRMLFARERQTKRQVLTRLGSLKKPAYRVTWSALRKYTPELFKSKVQELEDNFRGYLSNIDDRIAEKTAEHVALHVEPRLQELWDRDEKIATQLDELGRRVTRLFGAPSIEHHRTRSNGG